MSPGRKAFSDIEPVALSPAMKEVLLAAKDVAPTSTTVLLHGESGTGKEVIARYIHQCSTRAQSNYVAVNCAALPNELLESELFGHERGAFTGATERRVGKIELAHQGTLLLDEISELPLPLQAKLLRVIQEREVDRVGGQKPIPVDVRIIATSNRHLMDMVQKGQFRADLFYRLHVFPIEIPALRKRQDDLKTLVQSLLNTKAEALHRASPEISDAAWSVLATYPFPGNVRELGNVVERALILCRQGPIEPAHLSLPRFHSREAVGGETTSKLPALNLATLEQMAINEALRQVNGNRTHAARLLGIGLRTLRNKLNEPNRQNSNADAVAQTSQSIEAA